MSETQGRHHRHRSRHARRHRRRRLLGRHARRPQRRAHDHPIPTRRSARHAWPARSTASSRGLPGHEGGPPHRPVHAVRRGLGAARLAGRRRPRGRGRARRRDLRDRDRRHRDAADPARRVCWRRAPGACRRSWCRCSWRTPRRATSRCGSASPAPNFATISACSSSNHALFEALRLIRVGHAGPGDRRRIGVRDPAADGRRVRADDGADEEPRPRDRLPPFDADRDGFVLSEGAVHADRGERGARAGPGRADLLRARGRGRERRRIPHHRAGSEGLGRGARDALGARRTPARSPAM